MCFEIQSLFWYHRVGFVKTRRFTYMIILKGQGHVVTQVGRVAYESMRLDETNTLRPYPQGRRRSKETGATICSGAAPIRGGTLQWVVYTVSYVTSHLFAM